jgi:hypothetical protein
MCWHSLTINFEGIITTESPFGGFSVYKSFHQMIQALPMIKFMASGQKKALRFGKAL